MSLDTAVREAGFASIEAARAAAKLAVLPNEVLRTMLYKGIPTPVEEIKPGDLIVLSNSSGHPYEVVRVNRKSITIHTFGEDPSTAWRSGIGDTRTVLRLHPDTAACYRLCVGVPNAGEALATVGLSGVQELLSEDPEWEPPLDSSLGYHLRARKNNEALCKLAADFTSRTGIPCGQLHDLDYQSAEAALCALEAASKVLPLPPLVVECRSIYTGGIVRNEIVQGTIKLLLNTDLLGFERVGHEDTASPRAWGRFQFDAGHIRKCVWYQLFEVLDTNEHPNPHHDEIEGWAREYADDLGIGDARLHQFDNFARGCVLRNVLGSVFVAPGDRLTSRRAEDALLQILELERPTQEATT